MKTIKPASKAPAKAHPIPIPISSFFSCCDEVAVDGGVGVVVVDDVEGRDIGVVVVGSEVGDVGVVAVDVAEDGDADVVVIVPEDIVG